MAAEPPFQPVGAHPWADATGRISAKVAGIWWTNLVLQAGGSARTAFLTASLLVEDLTEKGYP